jgi:hypothetical protein
MYKLIEGFGMVERRWTDGDFEDEELCECKTFKVRI